MNWRILCYHTVDLHERKSFANQLHWFRAHRYRFRPFSQAFAERKDCSLESWVTVSFDDGDWTVCAVAQQVLADAGVRAILYLTTDYVLQNRTYQNRTIRPSVTWEQLGRWLEAGHEIGSHTHAHANLTLLNLSQRVEELGQTRDIIQRELGILPKHIAYPWGQHNDEICLWFRGQSDWESAATVIGRTNRKKTDPYRLGRFVTTADLDVKTLHINMLPMGVRFVRRRLVRTMARFRGSPTD